MASDGRGPYSFLTSRQNVIKESRKPSHVGRFDSTEIPEPTKAISRPFLSSSDKTLTPSSRVSIPGPPLLPRFPSLITFVARRLQLVAIEDKSPGPRAQDGFMGRQT